MREHRVTYLPSGTAVRVSDGTTLFNAAHWAGLPIESTCGGRGTCGKCAVRLATGPGEPTPADRRHLAEEGIQAGWRLSCQWEVRGDVTCEVPGLMHAPRAATVGVGRVVPLEPNVRQVLVELPEPSLNDARGHLRRLLDALAAEGLEPEAGPAVLSRLASLMRTGERRLLATVVGDRLVEVNSPAVPEGAHGVAVDIGTTTVVATLVDLSSGAVLAARSALNAQARYGADVITRMGRAMGGPEALAELHTAVLDTVNGLVAEGCAEAGVPAERVYEMVVVGNATMLHLFLGVDPSSIAVAPFVATFLDPQDLRAADVRIGIHPEGRVVLLSSIGAYVGADLVAGALAAGLAREEPLRLLVDVGTNGEIVLGSRERVVATAAPAGPAFEGGQVLHGMRATEGAIEGVILDDGVRLRVVGSAEPRGICGSGLIDAVAQLRLAGLLTDGGLLRPPEDGGDHPLADRIVERDGVRAFRLADEVLLTQLDIRELQSAKAAVATGIEVAMDALGAGPGDLDEVLLAGAFGTYINPQSARVIGLVPPVPTERIRAVGNAAGEGAKMALLSFREREMAFQLPDLVEYVELSAAGDFNERFIANLAFPALETVRAA